MRPCTSSFISIGVADVRIRLSTTGRQIVGNDRKIRAVCSYRNGFISAAHARSLLQAVVHPTACCKSCR